MVGTLTALQKSALFKDLEEGELRKKIIPYLLPLKFKNQSIILHEGEHSPGAYLLVEGKIKLSSHSDGRELIIDYVTPGHLFGHESCLSGYHSSVDCTAVLQSKCLLLHKEILRDLIFQHHELAIKIACDAYQQLENTRTIMTGLIFQPARQKVAGALCYLAKVNGTHEGGIIKATRSDVARLAAVTRETATRIVKEFEKEGLVLTDGKFAMIKKPEKLELIRDLYP